MKRILLAIAIMTFAVSAMAATGTDDVVVTFSVDAYVAVTEAGYDNFTDTGVYDVDGNRDFTWHAHFDVITNTSWSGDATVVGGSTAVDTRYGDESGAGSHQAFFCTKQINLVNGMGPHTATVTFDVTTTP